MTTDQHTTANRLTVPQQFIVADVLRAHVPDLDGRGAQDATDFINGRLEAAGLDFRVTKYNLLSVADAARITWNRPTAKDGGASGAELARLRARCDAIEADIAQTVAVHLQKLRRGAEMIEATMADFARRLEAIERQQAYQRDLIEKQVFHLPAHVTFGDPVEDQPQPPESPE